MDHLFAEIMCIGEQQVYISDLAAERYRDDELLHVCTVHCSRYRHEDIRRSLACYSPSKAALIHSHRYTATLIHSHQPNIVIASSSYFII